MAVYLTFLCRLHIETVESPLLAGCCSKAELGFHAQTEGILHSTSAVQLGPAATRNAPHFMRTRGAGGEWMTGGDWGREFGSLRTNVKVSKKCLQVDDAARFVRGAGSGAFKAGKHPPNLPLARRP